MSEAPKTGAKPAQSGAFAIGGLAVRIAMLVPVIALMIAAVSLIIYGAFETRHLIGGLFGTAPLTRDQALLHTIEIVDLFLLATVVQVVSLGIYQLYFRQDLQVPKWLKIETLDDLKSKLVGVVITVLAVFFLGQAVVWKSGPDIAYLGVGVAIIIAALTYFLSKIDSRHGGDPE